MSAVIALLAVVATTAFGAVYPWGYLPLWAITAAIGLAGLIRGRGIASDMRPAAGALALIVLAVAAQLVPMPRAALDTLSPHASNLLARLSLTFASSGVHPLSIDAAATRLALVSLCGIVLYVVGLPALISRRSLERLPQYLMLFGVVLAIGGLFGREHNNGLVYGVWQPEEGSNANGFGPFVNRNHYAGCMVMLTCLSLGVLCGRLETARPRRRPGWQAALLWLSTTEANRILLAAAAVTVMSIAVVWTMSRSGIISLAGAVAGVGWLMARRRSVAKSVRGAVVLTLAAILSASVSWRGTGRVVQWFADPADLVSRLGAWRDGWDVVRHFPFAGTGLNTYPTAMLFYQQNSVKFWMTHAHNDYLQLLAEGGLLVVVPAITAVVLIAAVIRRRLNDGREDSYAYWVRSGAAVGLMAMAIQEMVEFSLQMPANAFLFATLAALAICPVHEPRRRWREANQVCDRRSGVVGPVGIVGGPTCPEDDRSSLHSPGRAVQVDRPGRPVAGP